ncbi:hypothetical protein M0813_07470 [Anaeramoeba flamelloides]|uniref:Uncharacterized protein n=1 Tax=Anaeramoeba flamelloides TaxID=1746091 RepID=A0ABQ8XCK5_9EUKA|nr:hypothetical protein M0813_07470 [Anaeramoeba flamelloides]
MTDYLIKVPNKKPFDCNSKEFICKLQKKLKELMRSNYQEETRCVLLERLLPILSQQSFISTTEKTSQALRTHFLDLWCFLIQGIKNTYQYRKKLYSEVIFSLMKREEFYLPRGNSKDQQKTKKKQKTSNKQKTKNKTERQNKGDTFMLDEYSKCGKKIRNFLTFYREAMLKTQDWVENEMKDTYFLDQENECIRKVCANVLAISSFRLFDLRKTIHNSLWGEEENKIMKSQPRLNTLCYWVNRHGTENLSGLMKVEKSILKNKKKKRSRFNLCELLHKLEQPYLFSEKIIEESKRFCKQYLKVKPTTKKNKKNQKQSKKQKNNWKHSVKRARTNSSEFIVRRLEKPDQTLFKHLKHPLFLMDFIASLHSLMIPMVDKEQDLFQVPLFRKSLMAFVVSVYRMIKSKLDSIDNWLYFISRLANNPICYNLFIRTMISFTDMRNFKSVEHTLEYIHYILLELCAKNDQFPKELQLELIEYTLERLLLSDHNYHNLQALAFLHNFIYHFPIHLIDKFLYKLLFGKLFVKFFLSPFKLVRIYFSEFIVYQFIHHSPQNEPERNINHHHLKILLRLITQCEKVAKINFEQKESLITFATWYSSTCTCISNFMHCENRSTLSIKNFNFFQIPLSHKPYVKYAFPQLVQSLNKFNQFYKSARFQKNYQIPFVYFSMDLVDSKFKKEN